MSAEQVEPRSPAPKWLTIEQFLAMDDLVFYTNASRVDWFLRTNKKDILAAGIVLFGKGRAPNLYRRDFEAVALEIKAREQAAAAGVMAAPV